MKPRNFVLPLPPARRARRRHARRPLPRSGPSGAPGRSTRPSSGPWARGTALIRPARAAEPSRGAAAICPARQATSRGTCPAAPRARPGAVSITAAAARARRAGRQPRPTARRAALQAPAGLRCATCGLRVARRAGIGPYMTFRRPTTASSTRRSASHRSRARLGPRPRRRGWPALGWFVVGRDGASTSSPSPSCLAAPPTPAGRDTATRRSRPPGWSTAASPWRSSPSRRPSPTGAVEGAPDGRMGREA